MKAITCKSRGLFSAFALGMLLHTVFQGNGQTSPQAPSPTKLWEYRADGSVVAPLAVDETGVYFGSKDHRVYALDRTSGRLLWQRETGGMIRGGATVYDGVVYIGSTDHSLYALRAVDGSLLWRFPTVGAIMGQALVTEQRVFFGSNDHHLYCLDRKTGEIVWRFKSRDTIECLPALDHKRVFFGSGDNEIYALELETGKPVWQYSTGASVDGGVLIDRKRLYAASQDGFVYTLDPDTGRLVWRCRTGGTLETFPTPEHRDKIYVGGGHRNGRVSCVDLNGRLVWQKDLGGSVLGPVSPANGLLWGGSSSGTVKGLRTEDGLEIQTIMNGAAVLGGIRAYNDTIYWGDDLGRVQAWHTGN